MDDEEKRLVLRPRMGKRTRPEDRLLSRIGWSLGRARKGRSRVARAGLGRSARRVFVHAHIVRMTAYGVKAAALHLGYIQRDGVEKDGSPGVLYGPEGPARADDFGQPRPGERHQFRFIISPEDGSELDLTHFVRRVMARVERETGLRLEWAASNHYNTDRPHTHVVIRGVGRDGREVRFDRDYISHGIRGCAQEIATQELGPRSEYEIRRAQEREVTQERFTSLDRELERRAGGQDRVHMSLQARRGPIAESTLLDRLRHLEKMELAERASPREWSLAPRWQDTLRQLARRGDILAQMHAALSGDPSLYQVARPGLGLPDCYGGIEPRLLVGRVAAKGLSDELRGSFYAVLETPTGMAYHVPLGARAAEAVRVGDLVSFVTEREPAVRPVDRHIAEVSAAQAGLYDLGLSASSETPRAPERLRNLERLGLVASERPGVWRVSPDLLHQLEKREPRYRVVVRKENQSLAEQVRYRGPVWLDGLDRSSLPPYGFGAELDRLLEQRLKTLRELGIHPDDPSRLSKLLELERETVGRTFAAQSREAFAADAPDGFRGRRSQSFLAPSGRAYTIESDGTRFVVVRSTESGGRDGREVARAPDAIGRPTARTGPGRRRSGLE